MSYRERPSVVPGVTLWWRDSLSSSVATRILPDGCMDLIWDGSRLFVAGPDTRARWHASCSGAAYVGLRFSRGLGPALLDTAADQLKDLSPDLAELWPSVHARMLAERVEEDPAGALERWLGTRAGDRHVDRLGPAVFDLAAHGAPVEEMARLVGFSVRQLHRRCLPVFGYGPQHLRRVLRLGRALTLGRNGVPLARVATDCGFADQAHLSREVRDLAGTTPTVLLSELSR